MGRRVSVVGAGVRAGRGLGHALCRRCAVGLLQAAESAGTAVMAARLAVRRDNPLLGWLPRRNPGSALRIGLTAKPARRQ